MMALSALAMLVAGACSDDPFPAPLDPTIVMTPVTGLDSTLDSAVILLRRTAHDLGWYTRSTDLARVDLFDVRSFEPDTSQGAFVNGYWLPSLSPLSSWPQLSLDADGRLGLLDFDGVINDVRITGVPGYAETLVRLSLAASEGALNEPAYRDSIDRSTDLVVRWYPPYDPTANVEVELVAKGAVVGSVRLAVDSGEAIVPREMLLRLDPGEGGLRLRRWTTVRGRVAGRQIRGTMELALHRPLTWRP